MSNAKAYMNQFNSMFDFSQAAEMGRKQMEAMTAANQMMMETAQEATRMQTERAQENMQEMIEASRDVLSAGSPEAGLTKQAELTKHLFENGVESAREVTEMMTKSGMEAFELINQTTSEAMNDFQKKATKKK